MGTISISRYIISSTSAFTPVSANFPGKYSSAVLTKPGVNSRAVYRTTSRPCRFATRPHLLAIEPGGYSFSPNDTKSRSAARAAGSISGTPISTTSCPRDCSSRASAVIGFRCPLSGRLRKPIFIIASSPLPHHPFREPPLERQSIVLYGVMSRRILGPAAICPNCRNGCSKCRNGCSKCRVPITSSTRILFLFWKTNRFPA